MTKRVALAIIIAPFVLIACDPAETSNRTMSQQETSTLKNAGATSSFTLDYDAFTLDNGLQVILQRDASDPIVAVSKVIRAAQYARTALYTQHERPVQCDTGVPRNDP